MCSTHKGPMQKERKTLLDTIITIVQNLKCSTSYGKKSHRPYFQTQMFIGLQDIKNN